MCVEAVKKKNKQRRDVCVSVHEKSSMFQMLHFILVSFFCFLKISLSCSVAHSLYKQFRIYRRLDQVETWIPEGSVVVQLGRTFQNKKDQPELLGPGEEKGNLFCSIVFLCVCMINLTHFVFSFYSSHFLSLLFCHLFSASSSPSTRLWLLKASHPSVLSLCFLLRLITPPHSSSLSSMYSSPSLRSLSLSLCFNENGGYRSMWATLCMAIRR